MTALLSSSAPLCADYDLALLDLDGVVLYGDRLVNGAAEVLAALTVPVAYVTNNASRTPIEVAHHLEALGIPNVNPAIVVTAAQAAARLASEICEPVDRVLVIGGAGLRHAVVEHGLQPVEKFTDEPVLVVQGFSPDLNWSLLSEGTVAVTHGLPWIASNMDLTLPTSRGQLPGNGSFVNMISAITGRAPIIAGKPERHLYDETILRENSAKPLAVGDRIDTDIQAAHNAGIDSLLVMTGVSSIADLAHTPVRPSFVAAGIDGLLDPHPPVEVHGDHAVCAGVEVFHEFGVFRIKNPEGPITPLLRSITALAWHYLDRGGDRLDLSEVERVLGGRIKP